MVSTKLTIPRPQSVEVGKGEYLINGMSYPRVTTVLDIIDKPALRRWYVNQALDKVDEELSQRTGAHITRAEIDNVLALAKEKPDTSKNQAASFGGAAHDAIRYYIQSTKYPTLTWSGDPAIDGQMGRIIESFDEWRSSYDIEIELSEHLIWHNGATCDDCIAGEHDYAGTMDAVGYRNHIDDKTNIPYKTLFVADWKTGGLYREAYLQVAAYAHAMEQLTGEEVHEAWVVRIPRDPPKKKRDGTYTASFEAHRVSHDQIKSNFDLFRHALSIYGTLGDGWTQTKTLQGVLYE